MKLYATVTSERASKGQGGKELHIIIYDEEKHPAIAIKVRNMNGRVVALAERDMRYGLVKLDAAVGFLEETKGEKKKGEKRYCTTCGYVEAQSGTHCKECGNEMHSKI